jgi:hypothetical protein
MLLVKRWKLRRHIVDDPEPRLVSQISRVSPSILPSTRLCNDTTSAGAGPIIIAPTRRRGCGTSTTSLPPGLNKAAYCRSCITRRSFRTLWRTQCAVMSVTPERPYFSRTSARGPAESPKISRMLVKISPPTHILESGWSASSLSIAW